MTEAQIIFYVFAALVLGSALLVVTMQNLVRSVFLFFVTLFAIAGLYVFSLGDFIAVTQVIIYVGGVLVLMLFTFMLSGKQLLDSTTDERGKWARLLNAMPALIVAGVLLFILFRFIPSSPETGFEWIATNRHQSLDVHTDTTAWIGTQLMTRYLLPFEVASIFLMMALVGAAHLARKEKKA
jgi:NAD(P)H-quinone oxidoreductase subunit 6